MNYLYFLLSCFINFAIFSCSHSISNVKNQNFITSRDDTTTVYVTSTYKLRSRDIPEKVFQMINLKQLSIQGMDCDYGDTTTCWMIQEIPKQISNLKKLEILQLNVNAIRTVPKEIGDLKNLKTLDLTDNSALSDIEVVTNLTNLETLALFGCGFTKLPTDIEQLKKLKYLGLTGNNIDNVELDRIKKALPTCNIIYNK